MYTQLQAIEIALVSYRLDDARIMRNMVDPEKNTSIEIWRMYIREMNDVMYKIRRLEYRLDVVTHGTQYASLYRHVRQCMTVSDVGNMREDIRNADNRNLINAIEFDVLNERLNEQLSAIIGNEKS